jgi:peptidoglycan/LPS O-acetylase OafA/YrhL
MMAAGAVELALARGKLSHPYWRLVTSAALLVSASAILLHEQNGWFYARAAFLHHAIGWTIVGGAVLALARAFRPRSGAVQAGFALVLVVVSVFLFSDRDVAPIFGHISPLAGQPHR